MTDQTKQKIDAFVENLTGGSNRDKDLYLKAIAFGLELGKEAGPKKEPEDQFGGQFPVWSAVGFNEALTAKNAEIEKLIEEVKCL